MLHCVYEPPSNPLSFNLAVVVPRRSVWRVSYALQLYPQSKHSSLTAWTTGVSNPVCSPRFRFSASVTISKAAYAFGLPPKFNRFHSSLKNSTFVNSTQAYAFWLQFSRMTSDFHNQRQKPPTSAVRRFVLNKTCPPRLTAAADTSIGRGSRS